MPRAAASAPDSMHVDDAGHPSVVPMAVRTTAPVGTTFVDPGGCIDPFDGLIALLTDPADRPG